jgi:hypothetical protein
MDGVRFNGVYRLMPQFSDSSFMKDDVVGEVTKSLNAWVNIQNEALATKSDSFSRKDKADERRINPIEGLAVDMTSVADYNRRIIFITDDSSGWDLTEYTRRMQPLGTYATQGNTYAYGDVADSLQVYNDYMQRAVNKVIYYKKLWFKDGLRLQASVKENETSKSKPNTAPSEVVFREPTRWERFWMH